MCFYHDGYCEVWNETESKARKEHKCGECFGKIIIGEKYIRVFTIFERIASTTKRCQRCLRLLAAIREVEIEAGCAPGESQPSLGGMYEEVQGGDDGWQHYADEYSRLHPGEYIRWPFDLRDYMERLAEEYDNFWCDKYGDKVPDLADIGGEG